MIRHFSTIFILSDIRRIWLVLWKSLIPGFFIWSLSLFQGGSPQIYLLAFRLSSATSLSCKACTLRITEFSSSIFLRLILSESLSVLIRALFLSQATLRESVQWHHPASARQPHSAISFVHLSAESFRSRWQYLWSLMICLQTLSPFILTSTILICFSGPSLSLSWTAPSHLYSATS